MTAGGKHEGREWEGQPSASLERLGDALVLLRVPSRFGLSGKKPRHAEPSPLPSPGGRGDQGEG
ncbi:MAG: hypothetical protein KatS3mg105_1048 [Gemmatales bacterium]|nr:MAG: hypothetical protein KatS3mg105_1048 [Gemmatales bacterium]